MASVADELFNEYMQYLSQYQVLICRKCRFAVQPSAISGHLQRHKIFRERRKALMQLIETIPLLEPDQVNHPADKPPRLASLPAFQGYVCRHEGCEHSCASLKRMQRHWAVEHGRPCQADKDYRLTALQTFFRGNKVHYFEVTATPAELERNPDESAETDSQTSASITPSLASRDEVQTDTSWREELRLMHHFTVSTSLTISRGTEQDTFWPVYVPQLACECSFLMHCILAAAAIHLADLNPDKSIEYNLLADRHVELALPGHRHAVANIDDSNREIVAVTTRLFLIYHCASSLRRDYDAGIHTKPRVGHLGFLYLMRGGCAITLSVRADLLYWEEMRVDPRDIDDEAIPPPPPDIADRFNSLSRQLMPLCNGEAWQHVQPAISGLLKAFGISCATSEKSQIWTSLEYWPMSVNDGFAKLLADHHPAALVLFGHYCILIERVGDLHWFMRGHARSLLSYVAEILGDCMRDLLLWPLEIVGS